MTRSSSTRSIIKSRSGKSGIPSRRRSHALDLWMIEGLEDRCLLDASAFNWLDNVQFNQFTGGAPVDLGFGVTDLSPAGANVQAAPKFIGLDSSGPVNWDAGFSVLGAHTGASVSGSYAIKVGIEYGYYINTGTATLLHDGTVGFNTTSDPTSVGPTTIQTTVTRADGLVYTESPTLSAYANLVLDFNFNVTASAEVLGDSLGSIPVNINLNKTLPLFSINKQLADSNGNPVTNPDGTPSLDGQISFAAYSFIKDVKNAYNGLQAAYNKVSGAAGKLAAAFLESQQAQTVEQVQQARDDRDAANAQLAAGQSEEDALNRDSAQNTSFGAGATLYVDFPNATGGTLGVTANLMVGGKLGPVSLGELLGTMTVKLPKIDLVGQEDARGTIVATTDSYAAGSAADLDRDFATISVDPLALIGLGQWTANVAGFSASLTLAAYNIKASFAVNQTVNSSPASYPVTLQFTDAVTNAPVSVTTTWDGLVLTGTGRRYDAALGQPLQIQPPPGFTHQITVTATIDPVYNFSNKIGIDVGVTGTLDLLAGSLHAPGGLGTLSFGPLYTHTNTILDPTSLGTVYSKSFTVQSSTADTLGSFKIGPSADLAVALAGGPPTQINYDGSNPHPEIDYTVTVTNNGPDAATNVVLTDTLPSQVEVLLGSSTPGLVVNQGAVQQASLNVGALAPGQSVSVTVAGRFASGAGGPLASSFLVTSDQSDPVPKNNQLQESTTLVGPTIFTVLNETDLRNAVAQVNSTPNPAFVPIIDLPGGTITLTGGVLNVTSSVVIVGQGNNSTWLDGGGATGSAIFNFTGDAQQTYVLEDFNLNDGNGKGTGGFGGAIACHAGMLSIENCNFSNNVNTAPSAPGAGGAIYATGGTLNLIYVEFTSNQARYGGGLFLDSEAATLFNVKMSDNSASDPTLGGSAIFQGTLNNQPSVCAIDHSLFFHNQGPGQAPSLYATSTMTYQYSAFSTSATGGSGAPPNFFAATINGVPATLTSLGNNIGSDATGNLTAAGDRPNTQAGVFLSGPHQIASGQAGYVVGTLSLVWPGVSGTVSYNVSQQNQFQLIGNVLKVQDQQAFNFDPGNPAQFVTVSIHGLQDAFNNPIGPNNTNFQLLIVRSTLPPTSVIVTSSTGINEATSTTQQPGVLIGSVDVVDPNRETAFTFHVNDARFQVAGDPLSGYNLYLVPGQSLSYLKTPTIPIQITATNSTGQSFTSPYTVVVNQVIQTPTYINLSGFNLTPGVAGAVVGQLQTYSPNDNPSTANAVGEYTYSLSDPRFEVVNSLLQLQPGQSVPASATPIPVQVKSSNSAGQSVTTSFALNTLPTQTISLIGAATAIAPGGSGTFAVGYQALDLSNKPVGASVVSGLIFYDPNALTLTAPVIPAGDPFFPYVRQQPTLTTASALGVTDPTYPANTGVLVFSYQTRGETIPGAAAQLFQVPYTTGAGFRGTTVDVQANSSASDPTLGPLGTNPLPLVSAPAASDLFVTTPPPSSVAPGKTFGFSVTAKDANGNPVSSFNGMATVMIGTNNGVAVLSGPKTVPITNGVANFSGLTLSQPGTDYTLVVTTSGLNAATTRPFNVSTGSSVGILDISPGFNSYVPSLPGGMVTIHFSKPLAGLTDGGPALSPADPYGVWIAPRGPDGLFTGAFGIDSGILPVHANSIYHLNPDGTSSITITPIVPLATDVYLIQIDLAKFTDTAGDPLTDPQNGFYPFLLQTAPVNNGPLSVTGVTTYNGFTTVRDNPIFQPDTFTIHFNEPLWAQAAEGNRVQLIANPGPNFTVVPSVAAYSPSADAIILTPTAKLFPGTKYLIQVDASVSDDQGFSSPGNNTLGHTFFDTFTVINQPASSTSPSGLQAILNPDGSLKTLPASRTLWGAPLAYASVAFTEQVNLSPSAFGRYSAMVDARTTAADGNTRLTSIPLNDKLAFNPNTNQLIIVPTQLAANDFYAYVLSNIKATNGDPLVIAGGAPALYDSFKLQVNTPIHAASMSSAPNPLIAQILGPVTPATPRVTTVAIPKVSRKATADHPRHHVVASSALPAASGRSPNGNPIPAGPATLLRAARRR